MKCKRFRLLCGVLGGIYFDGLKYNPAPKLDGLVTDDVLVDVVSQNIPLGQLSGRVRGNNL